MASDPQVLRLLDALSVAVFACNAEGEFTYWSEGACRVTGQRGEGMPYSSFDVDGSPGIGTLWHRLASGEEFVEGVITLRHASGHEVHALAELRRVKGASIVAGSFSDLTRAQANRRLAEVRSPERTRGAFDRTVGESEAMKRVFQRLGKAAEIDVTVLIRGETGTGKELAAQAIHALSERSEKPMVCLNCSAIPEPLLESELFGHVKGAFTGALRDKRGVFEAASGGTLFLDEIGDMSPRMQVKLLRALQERQVRRVGSETLTPIDTRVVSATNQDLTRRIAAGEFREDLYYRIRVFEVLLPPLREREGDLSRLVAHFVRDLSLQHGKTVVGISPEAAACIAAYRWPGNVRELRNAIEHAFVTVEGDTLGSEDLPVEVQVSGIKKSKKKKKKKKKSLEEKSLTEAETSQSEVARVEPSAPSSPQTASAPSECLEEPERGRILAALREAAGKKGLAAAMLGVSRVTLWKRIKQYGIEPYGS